MADVPVPGEASIGSRQDAAGDTLASRAHDGYIIDSIIIENRDVYDTRQPKYDNFLFRTANKLHIVTRPHVISRELLLHVGEPFSSQQAEETARNLRTRYQMFDAWVESEVLPNGRLLVRVVTIDQWSLIGGIEMNREGNRTRYKFGFEERNLLGYNQFLSFDYVLQEDDENYAKTVFRDSRIFGFNYSAGIEHNTDPMDKTFVVSVYKPFYTLDQMFSYGVTAGNRGGRVDVYDDQQRIGQWQRHSDQFDASAEYRWGTLYDKVGMNTGYTYHSNRATDKRGIAQFPEDSLYHMPQIGFSVEHMSFTRMSRVTGFTFLEDFTISTGLRANFGRAFTQGLQGYYYNRLDFGGWLSKHVDSSLMFVDFRRSYWYRDGDVLRRYTEVVGRYYNTRISWLTLASRIIYRADKSRFPEHGVTLGGKAGLAGGLRGYDEVARTGERLAVWNIEARLFPRIEILSVIFGGVLFADIGRAWKAEEKISFSDLEYAIGAGLRISLEKATKSEIIRVDFAVTRYGDLSIAFGTGQYF